MLFRSDGLPQDQVQGGGNLDVLPAAAGEGHPHAQPLHRAAVVGEQLAILHGLLDGTPVLGADDYYFSSVTISQKDYGYDIYEDKMIDSERQSLVNAGKLDPGFGTESMCQRIDKLTDH